METIGFDLRVFLYITEKTAENIGKTAYDIAEMIIAGNNIKLNVSEIDDAEHMFAIMTGIEKVKSAVHTLKYIRLLDNTVFGIIEVIYKHKILKITTY